MPKALNLKGRTFGILTAIEPTCNTHKKSIVWKCKCSCGNTYYKSARLLNEGRYKSCGCEYKKHGESSKRGSTSKIYTIWQSIKRRCYYEKDIRFDNYGKKGILLYKEWLDDYRAFRDYVLKLENCPDNIVIKNKTERSTYSIDRINNDGNYEPGNIKWSTNTEQARNKSNNFVFIFRGKERCLAEIAELVEIPYKRLHQRIKRDGKKLMEAIAMG